MQKFRISLSVVTTLLAVSACGGSSPPPGDDSGPSTTDTGVHPGTDSAVDMGGSSTSGTCASPISIDTAGMPLTTGTGRMITQSNATAPAGQMSGLANGTCAIDNTMAPSSTHEVVFSYTVQTGGHLRISTNNPTSDMNLDSIVWALDACSMGATELGCNDDDFGAATQTYLSTAFTTSVSAGTRIFIVVAGFMGDAMSGTFTLTVTELPTNALGAACDTTTSPYCADGASCQSDDGTASAGHCLADGAANGACRLTAPFCDTSLVCTEMAPSMDTPGTCQTPIATGAVCSDVHPICVTGSSCQLDQGSDTMGHCLADGSEYGACHLTGTACDGALVCSQMTPTAADPGVCQTPVAAGDACTLDHHFLCVTGYSCQSNDGTMPAGMCLQDGAEYGQCRLAAPFCNTGFTCSTAAPTAAMNGTCQTPIAHAGACDPRHFLCVTGDTCIASSATMGSCVTDGTDGGACRAMDPACDGTLACGPDGLCAAP